MLTWNATEYPVCFSDVVDLRITCQYPTGLDLGNRYKDDCESGDGSFVCALLHKLLFTCSILMDRTSISAISQCSNLAK